MNEHQAVTTFSNTVSIELKLLQAEVGELTAAVAAGRVCDVLDEVVDVLYRARAVAVEAGLPVEALDEYGHFKSKLRAHLGKDKRLEEHVARGVVDSYLVCPSN